jgi:predicted MFS family arabinose efflux permease
MSTSTFVASLSGRAVDPILPHIAADFAISIPTAAILATATALSLAFVQPILGATADFFGKPRLITICLVILGIANILSAFATNFPMLLASRVLVGIGSGGVFPVSLGLTGDLFSIDKRQIAMSRVLAGAMSGNVLGASFSGIIGDFVGWRGVFLIMGSLVLIGSIGVILGFRNLPRPPSQKFSFATLMRNYRQIFSHPHARVCYAAVFVEGLCIYGMFPFVASFLHDLGEPRMSIAGLVIAGFAIGGLVYSSGVSRLLPLLGVQRMMLAGAVLMASQLLATAAGPGWQIQGFILVALGLGFYMLHGSLQMFATEISPQARATATSLHTFFFFLGQSAGPLLYGTGLLHFGKVPTLATTATLIVLVGLVCSRLLRRESQAA